MSGGISFGLAFLAGLASFLSPCVLPVVPSYLTFVTGMTLDELSARGGVHERAVRRRAAMHASIFVLGFMVVFVTLGATATAFGAALQRVLPLLQRIGGVLIAMFGLVLLGALRILPLMRERRMHLSTRPAGVAGSFAIGIAFGAGWTPCVGPVLASILLYAGMDATATRGMLLLATYALGLGAPFLLAAVGLNWFLARSHHLARWLRPIEMLTGAILVLVGMLLVTGRFGALTAFLAGYGQFLNVE